MSARDLSQQQQQQPSLDMLDATVNSFLHSRTNTGLCAVKNSATPDTSASLRGGGGGGGNDFSPLPRRPPLDLKDDGDDACRQRLPSREAETEEDRHVHLHKKIAITNTVAGGTDMRGIGLALFTSPSNCQDENREQHKCQNCNRAGNDSEASGDEGGEKGEEDASTASPFLLNGTVNCFNRTARDHMKKKEEGEQASLSAASPPPRMPTPAVLDASEVGVDGVVEMKDGCSRHCRSSQENNAHIKNLNCNPLRGDESDKENARPLSIKPGGPAAAEDLSVSGYKENGSSDRSNKMEEEAVEEEDEEEAADDIVLSEQPTDLWGSPMLKTPQTALTTTTTTTGPACQIVAFPTDPPSTAKGSLNDRDGRDDDSNGSESEDEDDQLFSSPVPKKPVATPLLDDNSSNNNNNNNDNEAERKEADESSAAASFQRAATSLNYRRDPNSNAHRFSQKPANNGGNNNNYAHRNNKASSRHHRHPLASSLRRRQQQQSVILGSPAPRMVISPSAASLASFSSSFGAFSSSSMIRASPLPRPVSLSTNLNSHRLQDPMQATSTPVAAAAPGLWREQAPSRCSMADSYVDNSMTHSNGEQNFIFIDNGDGTGVLADATLRLDGSCVLGQTVLLAQSHCRGGGDEKKNNTNARGVANGSVSPVVAPPPQSPLPHQRRREAYVKGEDEETHDVAEQEEALTDHAEPDGSFNYSINDFSRRGNDSSMSLPFPSVFSPQPKRVARLALNPDLGNPLLESSDSVARRRSAAPSRCAEEGSMYLPACPSGSGYPHSVNAATSHATVFSPSASLSMSRSRRAPSIWMERSVNYNPRCSVASPSPVPVQPSRDKDDNQSQFNMSASPVPFQPSFSPSQASHGAAAARERRAPSPSRGDSGLPNENEAIQSSSYGKRKPDLSSAASSLMVVMPDVFVTPDALAMQGWVPVRLAATDNGFISNDNGGVSVYNSPDFRRRPTDRVFHSNGCGACSPLPRDPADESGRGENHPNPTAAGDLSFVDREGSPARLDASSLFSAATLASINRRLNLSMSMSVPRHASRPAAALQRADNNNNNKTAKELTFPSSPSSSASRGGKLPAAAASVAEGARLLPTPSTPADNNNSNNAALEAATMQWDVATPMGSVNLASFAASGRAAVTAKSKNCNQMGNTDAPAASYLGETFLGDGHGDRKGRSWMPKGMPMDASAVPSFTSSSRYDGANNHNNNHASAASPVPLAPSVDRDTVFTREDSPSRCTVMTSVSNSATQFSPQQRETEKERAVAVERGAEQNGEELAASDLLTSMSYQRPSTAATSFFFGGGGGTVQHGDMSLPISSSSISVSINPFSSQADSANKTVKTGDLFTPQSRAAMVAPAPAGTGRNPISFNSNKATGFAATLVRKTVASQRLGIPAQPQSAAIASPTATTSTRSKITSVAGYFRQQQQQQQQQHQLGGRRGSGDTSSGTSMALYSVNASSFTCSTNTTTNDGTTASNSSVNPSTSKSNAMQRSFQTTYCKRATTTATALSASVNTASTVGSAGIPLTRGQLGGISSRQRYPLSRGGNTSNQDTSGKSTSEKEVSAAPHADDDGGHPRELQQQVAQQAQAEDIARRVQLASAAIANSARFTDGKDHQKSNSAAAPSTASSFSAGVESSSSASTWSITAGEEGAAATDRRSNQASGQPPNRSGSAGGENVVPVAHEEGDSEAVEAQLQQQEKKKKKMISALEHRVNLPPRRVTTEQPDTSVFLPWSPLTIATPDASLNLFSGAATKQNSTKSTCAPVSSATTPSPSSPAPTASTSAYTPTTTTTATTTEAQASRRPLQQSYSAFAESGANPRGKLGLPNSDSDSKKKSKKSKKVAAMSSQAMAALSNMMALASAEGEHDGSSQVGHHPPPHAESELEEANVDLIASYLFQQAAFAMARSGAPGRAPLASSFSMRMTTMLTASQTDQHRQSTAAVLRGERSHEHDEGDGLGAEDLRQLEDDFVLSLAATMNAYQRLGESLWAESVAKRHQGAMARDHHGENGAEDAVSRHEAVEEPQPMPLHGEVAVEAVAEGKENSKQTGGGMASRTALPLPANKRASRSPSLSQQQQQQQRPSLSTRASSNVMN